jgi:hypothetical protein
MIVEVRTYQLKPGSVAEVEKRFGEALPAREKLSKLTAFWHTEVGPLFEIRAYTLAPGAIPGMIERWAGKIDARAKLSPLVGAWYSEFGGLNKWVHIWAYRDAAERQRVRAEAVATGVWPPGGAAAGLVLKQENKLVMPASFSPIR